MEEQQREKEVDIDKGKNINLFLLRNIEPSLHQFLS
jgi:hypothetical protein